MNDINNSEYIYLTIPSDYEELYKRILIILAEYGEDMLKDCKASCTDRNRDIIDCFNMFNSAVAARELGQTKLAETIIKYVKAKLKMMYGWDIDINTEPVINIPIYYGAGATEEAATNELIGKSTPKGDYTFTVTEPESYVWILVPNDMVIHSASLNNFDFPLDAPYTIQKDGTTYNVYRSSNTYDAVVFTIKVI